MNRLISAILLILLFSQCSTPTDTPSSPDAFLHGLWEVKKVAMGQESMTPVAKWFRLEADGRQSSGNGWLQHIIGTWQYNSQDSTIQFVNTNGWKDENGPFRVQMKGEQMIWQRQEEGQLVTVTSERIKELPLTPGNQALGVWALDSLKLDGAPQEVASPSYLHLRWDSNFRFRKGKEQQMGIWKFHGHRPTMEWVIYDENNTRQEWEVKVESSTMTLTSTKRYQSATRNSILSSH